MSLNWLALRGLSRNVLGPWTSSYRSGGTLARGLRTGARYGPSRRYSRLGVAAVGLLGGSIYLEWPPKVYADELDRPSQMKERSPTPLSTLIRTYGVYSMCSIPALIDWAPSILSFMSSIPVVRQITEAFVRQTFFAQVSLLASLSIVVQTLNTRVVLSSSAVTLRKTACPSLNNFVQRTRDVSSPIVSK